MSKELRNITGELSYVFNCRKSVEAMLYVINRMGGSVNRYNLLKIMFAADKHHINRHGIPVTGDVYMKEVNGTAPYELTKLLDGDDTSNYSEALGMENLPIKLTQAEGGQRVSASQKADRSYLLDSVLEALDAGIKEYGSLSEVEVCTKNHQERCWLETPDNEKIPFELIIENAELLEDLLEHP